MANKYRTIPVMITGGFKTGKTTFIRAVSDLELAGTQRTKNANPIDVGRLYFPDDRIIVHLYGRPCSRMPPDRPLLAGDTPPPCVRTIILVDSVFVDPFPKAGLSNDDVAFDLIDCVQRRRMPFLVVASKQDLEKARSVEEMRVALRLAKQIQLLPCSAKTDPTSVRHVLIELLKLGPPDEVVRRAIFNLERLQRAAA